MKQVASVIAEQVLEKLAYLQRKDIEEATQDIGNVLDISGGGAASEIISSPYLRQQIQNLEEGSPQQTQEGLLGALRGGLLGGGFGALTTGIAYGSKHAPMGAVFAIPGAMAGYIQSRNAQRRVELQDLLAQQHVVDRLPKTAAHVPAWNPEFGKLVSQIARRVKAFPLRKSEIYRPTSFMVNLPTALRKSLEKSRPISEGHSLRNELYRMVRKYEKRHGSLTPTQKNILGGIHTNPPQEFEKQVKSMESVSKQVQEQIAQQKMQPKSVPGKPRGTSSKGTSSGTTQEKRPSTWKQIKTPLGILGGLSALSGLGLATAHLLGNEFE